MLSFSTLLLALNAAGIAWTAAVPEAAIADQMAVEAAPLEKRQSQPLYAAVFKDANYQGAYTTLYPTQGRCLNVPANFNDAITSITVPDYSSCLIWADADCKGAVRNVGDKYPQTYPNLATINFNDVMSSIICVYKNT